MNSIEELNFNNASTTGRNDGEEIAILEDEFLFLGFNIEGSKRHHSQQEFLIIGEEQVDVASEDQFGVHLALGVDDTKGSECGGLRLHVHVVGTKRHTTEASKNVLAGESKRTYGTTYGQGNFNGRFRNQKYLRDVEKSIGVNEHRHESGSWSKGHCGDVGAEQAVSQIGDLATISSCVDGQHGTRWDR